MSPPVPPRRPAAHRAPPSTGPLALAAALAGEALRLVVPEQCAGCGVWDAALCEACAVLLAGPPYRCEEAAPRLDRPEGLLPVWAAAAYTGAVRDVVVAWKDRGRTDVSRHLAAAVRTAARAAARPLAVAAGGEQVVVVPVPSRPGARMRRGGDRTAGLAAACAAGLRSAGVDARADAALAVRGVSRDQVGLGARARGRNLAGGFRTRGRPDRLRGRWCVVVDDVLTTGSTLAAATRALAVAGAVPLAGVVLAATPAPTRGEDLRPLPVQAGPG